MGEERREGRRKEEQKSIKEKKGEEGREEEIGREGREGNRRIERKIDQNRRRGGKDWEERKGRGE